MTVFVQVDCTANTETCKHYGVTGYPTLKIFRNGQESSLYDGPRSAGMFNDGWRKYNSKSGGYVIVGVSFPNRGNCELYEETGRAWFCASA